MIEITNLSPHQRAGWVTCVVPVDASPDTPTGIWRDDFGNKFAAVKGQPRGNNVLWHIQVRTEGGDVLRGQLEPGSNPLPEWTAHPAVVKAVQQGGANVVAEVDGVDYEIPWRFDAQQSDPARAVFRASRVCGPVVVELWAHVYPGDPVVRVWSKVICRDPSPDRWATKSSVLVTIGGEVVNFGPTAERIEWHYGAAWCGAGTIDLADSLESPADKANMMAATEGDLVAIYTGPRRWLAWPHKPPALRTVAELEEMASRALAFGRPVLTCDKDPSRPGDQDDFGATAGAEFAAPGNARYLETLREAVYTDPWRGGHYLMDDGTPAMADALAKWITWRGDTHYRRGISGVTFGKDVELIRPGNGWFGYDEQHRSQNHLAAYLEIADDPAILHYLECIAQVDLADYRVRHPSLGYGAARAVGRKLLCWSNFAAVTGWPVWERLIETLCRHALARVAAFRVKIPPLNVIPADNRTIPFPSVSIWEHALGFIGALAAHARIKSDLTSEVVDVTANVLRDALELTEDLGQCPQNIAFGPDGMHTREAPKLTPWAGDGTGMWVEAALSMSLRNHDRESVRLLGETVQSIPAIASLVRWWSDPTNQRRANWFGV